MMRYFRWKLSIVCRSNNNNSRRADELRKNWLLRPADANINRTNNIIIIIILQESLSLSLATVVVCINDIL